MLTGVDITSYGANLPGAPRLGTLVKQILKDVPELERLRLSSIDSVEADADLLDALASEPRLMPHLHLSLQAGDDLILKRMKRRHLRADAIAFCDQVRRLRPDVVFGADIIAGFPTETEEMFARSLDLVDECGLTHLHVFPFSPRPGTPAARMPQVAREVVKERAAPAAREGRGGAAPPSRRRGRRAPARADGDARCSAAPSSSRRCGSPRRSSPASSSTWRSPATTADNCWRRDRLRGQGEESWPRNGSKPNVISTMAELEALYAEPVYPPAKVKETDRITGPTAR